MRRIRLHEAAVEEAIEAAAWYEQERPGLGTEFGQAINFALDLLEDKIVPLSSMPGKASRHNIKRLILRRFPYNIVVRESPGEVLVIAIAHQSRKPGYWRKRLR